MSNDLIKQRYPVADAYEKLAGEYDGWFENNPLFASELVALKSIKSKIVGPALEIGIGPGRFAQSLGIQFGIDPAIAPLRLARERGVFPCRAAGESLPFRNNTFSSAYILFTECFLVNPEAVFKECHRVLGKRGFLILGMVPAGSRWGETLAQKGRKGNPFYKAARFNSVEDIETMLNECGFQTIESVSTLYQSPENSPLVEEAKEGFSEEAGFVILVCAPTQRDN